MAKYICVHPGCDKPRKYKSWCRQHGPYKTQRAALNALVEHPERAQIEARFWAKVDRDSGTVARVGLSPCWLWTGGPHVGDSHGHFDLFGFSPKAHQVAWVLANGPLSESSVVWDPEAEVVRHTCDVRKCVRNDLQDSHLIPGTQLDNIADRVERKRNAIGERTGVAVLTDEQVMAMRTRYATDPYATYASLAKAYGVGDTTVESAIRGVYWTHLPVVPSQVSERYRSNGQRVGDRSRRLVADDIVQIRQLARDGMLHTQIARLFNTTDANVGYIVRRVTWRHVS